MLSTAKLMYCVSHEGHWYSFQLTNQQVYWSQQQVFGSLLNLNYDVDESLTLFVPLSTVHFKFNQQLFVPLSTFHLKYTS